MAGEIDAGKGGQDRCRDLLAEGNATHDIGRNVGQSSLIQVGETEVSDEGESSDGCSDEPAELVRQVRMKDRGDVSAGREHRCRRVLLTMHSSQRDMS